MYKMLCLLSSKRFATLISQSFLCFELPVCTHSLEAQSTCGVNDMKGIFTTQPRGVITAGPLAGPFAVTGRLIFDGRGRFSGAVSSSFNGLIFFPSNVTGNYSVTSDCILTAQDDALGIVH